MFRYLLAAQKCVYVQFGHHPPPSLLLSHLISTLNITFSRDSEVFLAVHPPASFLRSQLFLTYMMLKHRQKLLIVVRTFSNKQTERRLKFLS